MDNRITRLRLSVHDMSKWTPPR
ncbi:PTS transporter subunit EIIB [Klebsiella pneumoniae subsp. pneumoniae]|nr:PTS transporter subunit EIIB [Klebsiella pneumoniae subsp. pneumoniae]